LSLIRDLLLKASQNAWLRESAPHYRFVRSSARRFLPGEDASSALEAAEKLGRDGVSSLVTHLGENVSDRTEAEKVTADYGELLDRIRAANLPSEISVKLTQLGLDVDAEICFANLTKLLGHALHKEPDSRRILWIDMEQSAYVDATLEMYRRARAVNPRVGVCIQAYLYRTEQDAEALLTNGAAVRLVKGAYSEPAEIAYPKKRDVDESYLRLAKMFLASDPRRAGVRAALATHDLKIIGQVSEWAAQQGIGKNQLEFAMLYGIEREEQLRLAREGYRSCVLISYGAYWFPWFVRRLAERPANLLFLARNIFSG
jgi:proline dehydrogenase